MSVIFRVEYLTAKCFSSPVISFVRLIDSGSCALRVHQVDVFEVNAVTICDSLQPICEVSWVVARV